jgi:hypothetical protein
MDRDLKSETPRQEADVSPYTRDFGGFLHRVPRAVVRTRSEVDVRQALQAARGLGVPVTVRGAGHSCNGQCLSDGGLVLVNETAEAAFRHLPGGRIEVPARCRWSGVVRALHREGWTLPVVTNHLGTTVGGTLSAGGFGVASIARGAQIDHVERLRLVLVTGETVECSRTERPELFALALGGMGQAGVIETAVIATVPWRPRARLAVASFDSLTELVASLWPLAGEAELPDYFFAEWTGGPFTATRAVAGDGQSGEVDVETWLDFGEVGAGGPPSAGPCHVWSDYVFDFDALARFAEHVELGMSLGLLMPHLSRVYLLGLAPPPAGLRSPFDPRPPGAGVRGFGIGLYYTLPPGDEPAVRQARSIQDSLLDTCLGLGGRPYRSGYHRLRPEEEAKLYGLTPPRAV